MSSTDKTDEICVLCCRDIPIYASGPCDHHVCYECSTRMRVLCERNECPICRSDMPIVFFTHTKKLFSASQKYPHLDKKSMIVFEDKYVQEAFEILLKHSCESCGDSFPTFAQLKDHVRRQHTLFYCELCVDNLMIFTFERKCYSRKDLARHKRLGDPDDTSHRGHPLCEFCDQRFVDNDELYRHLRREHFFCHFCDADGKHQYYGDYVYLKNHFRKEHHLCEEEDCAKEQFTGAFRSEIDLRAHKAINHTKNKSKAEVKQARTLGLEFNYTPRNAPNGESSSDLDDHRQGRYGRQNNHHRKRNIEDNANAARETSDNQQSLSKTFNTQCVEDFPHLSNEIQGKNENPFSVSSFAQHRGPNRSSTIKNEDFPALCSRTAVAKETAIQSRKNINFASNQNFKQLPVKDPIAYNRTLLMQGRGKNQSESQSQKKQTRAQKASGEDSNGYEDHASTSSTHWLPKKKSSANFDEEFPKLAVKDDSSFGYVPLKREETAINPKALTSIAQLLVPTSSQQDESIAHQLYLSCKSKKKKNKYINESENNFNTKKCDARNDVDPLSLRKLYTGVSNHNVLDNLENEDPSRAKVAFIDNYKVNYIRKDKEEVPWQETVNLAMDDFPPLGPSAGASRGPPGFKNPSASNQAVAPPGFSKKSLSGLPKTSLSVTLSSILKQPSVSAGKLAECNDEETSKSGSPAEYLYCYKQPLDFDKRNNILIQRIRDSVNTDGSFGEFKSLSGNFRQSKILASEYHTKCLDVLGQEGFLQIYSELVSLLPDISKQQELLAVHNTFLKNNSKVGGTVSKWGISPVISLLVCSICQQVLAKQDFTSHQKIHENEP